MQTVLIKNTAIHSLLRQKGFMAILVFVLWSSLAPAQLRQPSFFILGEEQFDGIQIYDVIQDDALNYWIATDNGIYKYDCYGFSKIECEGAQALSAFGFVKNKTGTIYCYNLNNQILQIRYGICSLLYELTAQERSADIYLSITAANELLVLTKTALIFDENGKRIPIAPMSSNYYGYPFLTGSGQTISHIADSDSLWVYKDHRFKTVGLKVDGVQPNGVLKFFTLSGKTFAISTASKEIYAFDESAYTLHREPATDLEKSKEFFRIYNENNQVWAAGIISGVFVISDNHGLTLSEKYYPQYLISDVYHDAEGNLLLSTFNHGILVVPNMAIPDVLNIPGNSAPVSIHIDDQLGMLMGTLNGQLLSYKDGAYQTLSDSGSRPLQSVFSWPGFPFVLFDDGKVKMLNKETREIFPFTIGSLKDAVMIDDTTLYLALNTGLARMTWGGGNKFTLLRIESLHLRCYSVAYSSTEKLIYVATSDGVSTLDADGKISNVLLNGERVFANDIAVDGNFIYLATKNGILTCRNSQVTGSIQPTIQGKTVEVLKLVVQNDRINAITAGGFAVFDKSGTVLIQLNTKYGFSTNRIYDFEISGNGLWICHSKGVQQLAMNVLNSTVTKPLMKISTLMVNEFEVTNLGTTLGIYTSEERKFRFTLSSPTLRNKENIRYHYQLKGYDETWYVADYTDNEIVYNALAPGAYMFSVKAENMGVFSETVWYSFTISAPFYSQWWFSVFVGLVLLVAISLIYKNRLQVQRKKAQLENELYASRLTAIQSQMNPHFIFNSLNSIQDLVLKGDVDNSYSFITKFSNLVRRTLNYSDKDFVEFSQEIKLIELYLSLEKLRFRDDLDYSIETEGIDDIMVPPMLIQPFIENALLHGLLHKEGKKRLTVRFRMNEVLTCVIEDNGVGRARAKDIKERQRADHESFSGEAIKKRFSILSQIFKGELGYTYEDLYEGEVPSGTRVILTIPVKRNF
ncbi:MAG TPA: histidine kinase [Bacteroidia bacterium]|nr:histidine kinase [Bacteroidia bacterium]